MRRTAMAMALVCGVSASAAQADPPGRPASGAVGPSALGPDSLGANWRPQQDEARQGVRSGRYIPLSRVLDEIRRTNPGRQLVAGLESEPDGRAVYRVRWAAANGRRLDYIVDAETGRILRAEGR